MNPSDQPLSGSEYVMVAQVPKAGGRWKQVHFNAKIAAQFFRMSPGDRKRVALERVDGHGYVRDTVARPLVMSEVNKNCKIEFDFGDLRDYPSDGVPLLAVLELDLRTFRYVLLLPGDGGYGPMLQLNHQLASVGRGLPRVITTLDEVELRWPACPLRSPKRPLTA
jgi:hypothetical protein